jgi:hypothetical protein
MALLFALVTGSVAYLSYMSEFADGSTLTEAIDVLAPQLHSTHAERAALAARRAIVLEQSGRLTAQFERIAVEIRETATRMVRESKHDQAIRYARSVHQQNGSGGQLPAPRLTFAVLDLTARQAAEFTERQTRLGVPASGSEGPGLAVVQ